MNTIDYQSGKWQVQCLPDDGARLSMIRFAGRDLLTSGPGDFRPPSTDYGIYETRRSVYGYDDCFPTVDACDYPLRQFPAIPDHGELCWLSWQVSTGEKVLGCTVRSRLLPVQFKRSLIFDENILRWKFEVINSSCISLPFQHVMHPMMPLNEIVKINLPGFSELFDEMKFKILTVIQPGDLTMKLLNQPQGTTEMLLLKSITAGQVELCFRNEMKLRIIFPVPMFPTIGIWWNKGGYPDEDGCRRTECAFEPIPGSCSRLSDAYKDGFTMTAAPNDITSWTITWQIEDV